jgi:hypothetical protein
MKTNYETLVDLVIKAETAGKPRHELLLDVCATPAFLLALKLSPLRIVIKAKTVGKAFFDHGLTQGQIERVPAMLGNPKAIYKSATRPGSVVVLTYEIKGGSPIIVPIAKDQAIGRGPLVNEVSSVYAKTGPDPTPGWKAQGLLLWEGPVK